MGLFLGWCHKLLCMHVYKDFIRCKSVCDVYPGIDPYPLLARSCNRWWLDFVTFTAYKKVQIEFKKVQCVSNRCKDLFKRKKNTKNTNKEASTTLCSVVKHAGSGRVLKKWGKTLNCVSCFPLHFFCALPLPACFTTEHSAVEASLFANLKNNSREKRSKQDPV